MVIASSAQAAELFAAYAPPAPTASASPPGIGWAGADWMRQCELVAEAHTMLS